MPSKKKQKTKHAQHSNQNGELSHAEIWDDSALLRSWNDAVKEYEYYHSIHARGEDVEEVLRQAELAEEADSAMYQDDYPAELAQDQPQSETQSSSLPPHPNLKRHVDEGAGETEEGEVEDGEIDELEDGKLTDADDTAAELEARRSAALSSLNAKPAIEPPAPVAQPASTALSMDDALENIKMAYYWAGYYSGLYEGQRQATVTKSTMAPESGLAATGS